jgi:hypothetical protein
MTSSSHEERLPCGTEYADLLVQVADDQPASDSAHQSICPFCQSTLRRLRQDWAHVEAAVRQRVELPPGLTAKIMARVRVLTAQVADFVVLGEACGETRISHLAVGRVIQHLAMTTPGVAFASVKLLPRKPAHPRQLTVAIKLVILFGPTVKTVAEGVRDRMRRRAAVLTGAELTRVDLEITDIAGPLQ